MRALLRRAGETRVFAPPWAAPETLDGVHLDVLTEQKLELTASIHDVQKVLAKELHPGRKQLSVVRFEGGKLTELTEANAGLVETEASEPEADPPVAATVAAPYRGCPAPDFPNADVRATRVLREFLSPVQVADFEKHQAFVALGADTGHRYQITSRHARTPLALYRRTLYDLDEARPLCVHDWDVPAAEEMLAIFLCVSLPGREHYVRVLEE